MTRILLVDDSQVILELTKIYLMGRAVNLLEARDGEEALRVVRTEHPDLVIADLRMPKLDGPGLCAAMRGEAHSSGIPVIIMTSDKDAAARERCLSAGAREVLTKPVAPAALKAAIQRYLPS
jgi:two-component system chemotaxis response regulator CheY